MKKSKLLILLIVLLACITPNLYGQFTIETEILIAPPYPTNLDAYVDYLEEGVIEVNNLTDNAQEVYFDILLEETSGKIRINSEGLLNQSVTIQPGLNVLSPMDIQDIFSGLTEANFNTNGLSQAEKDAIMLNRQMPEGTYRICIKAFDELGTALSDPSLGCIEFDVFFAERPIIMAPFDGEEADTSGFLFVTWDHTINSPGVMDRLEYTVKIIDITEQAITNVELAMLDPGISPEYEEELGNEYTVNLLDGVDMPLEIGHQYAIRVTATDPDESLGFQFGGHSEIVVFYYGNPNDIISGDLLTAPEIVSPENTDNLQLTEDSTLTINVEWTHEIDESLRTKVTYMARLLAIDDPSTSDIDYITNESTELTWESDNIQTIFTIEADDETELELGTSYALLISAESTDENLKFENEGHSQVITFSFGESSEGAPDAPVIATPVDDDYLPKKEIPVEWSHIFDKKKIKTNQIAYIVQIIDLTEAKLPSPEVEDFQDEKIKKLIDQPIVKKKTVLKPTGAKALKDYHKYAMVILAETTQEDVDFKNNGYSDIVTFTHGVRPADADGCDADKVAITIVDKNPVAIPANAATTKLYKMGTMDLRVKTLKPGGSAAAGYNGTGEVKVGFLGLGTRVLVDFKGIKVNKSGQVISGSAEASYDDAFGNVDKLAAVGASTLLDVDFDEAKNLNASLRSSRKLVSALSGTQAVSLPIGFDKTVENDTMIVGITKMTFTPQKANLMALFSMVNPDWGDYVPTLGASDIEFHNNGFEKQIRLYLHEDYPIETDGGTITIKKSDPNNPEAALGTYVELNCKGFKKAQLTAELPIPRDILVPEEEDGTLIEDPATNVILTLSGTIERQSNFMLSAGISPCQIPGLEGFSLSIKNGTYDGSERSNPPGIAFPQGYEVSEASKTWKGVWFEEVLIKAPADWGAASGGNRTTVGMKNFIKDDAGISLNGVGYNLLNIEDGSFEGFAVSMDTISINIIRNQFINVSLSGQMGMPILPDDSYLSYEGIVDMSDKPTGSNGNNTANNQNSKDQVAMSFTVKPDENGYYMPWVKSTIKFDKTTEITIKNDNKERGVEAKLEGSIAIGDTRGEDETEEDESVLQFPSLKFSGMKISSLSAKAKTGSTTNNTNQNKKKNSLVFVPPTIEFKGFSPGESGELADDEKGNNSPTKKGNKPKTPQANGFTLGLTEVSLAFGNGGSEEQELTNGMDLKLTVGAEVAIVRAPQAKSGTKKAKKGFELSAKGKFSLISKVMKTDDKITFKYDRFDSASMAVDSKLGPIGVKGSLEIYNQDEVFGKGVVGDVAIEVPMLNVNVEARFGNKPISKTENFDYFYLFGKVDVISGIPIPQTPIKLHRFLGGAYSKMSVKPGAELVQIAKDKYIPNKDVAFGFKAGLGFSVTSPSAVFANMAFELAVNTDGGIERISLDGQVDMMQQDPFGDLSGDKFEGIRLQANATILPALEGVAGREAFKIDCSFLAKANLANKTIVGAQSGGQPYQVVRGKLDISGESFGLTMGSYEVPGIIRAKLGDQAGIDGKFYLQASYGKTVDFKDAPVPDFITRLLNQGKNKDFESKGGNPLTDKAPKTYPTDGLALAAGLNITAEANVKYSILYARFKAMLGFDMSLKTNKNTLCANLSGSSMGMGKDGYYAKGQVYAGLEGDVGLDVDVFGYKGKMQLAYVYAAMLMQGGFANPSWISGEASMGYSVLGGLVSGNTSFEIQIGEKCQEYQAEPFAGVKFIEGIDPDKNKSGVSVFVKPIVSFENKLGLYTFKNENGYTQKYDVRLDRFEILGKNFNKVVSYDKLSAHLDVTSLSPQKKYTITAKVKVYKWNGYSWVPAKGKDENTGIEKEIVEEVSHTFTTGKMPNYVPWSNVKDCYPFRNESYYMINDNVYNQGLIELGASQSSLFERFTPANQQWHSKVVAVLWDNTEQKFFGQSDVTYHAGKNVIQYKMPSSQMKTGRSYAASIRRVWYKNDAYDTSSKDIADETNNIQSSAKASSNYTFRKEGKSYKNATNKRPGTKVLFEYWFKTSKYKTFAAKVKGGSSKTFKERQNYSILEYDINNSEGFSEEEIGYKYIAESRSINKNLAFIQEDLTKFGGAYMIPGFLDVRKRHKQFLGGFENVVGSSLFEMEVFGKHKFEGNNWKKGFYFYDLPSRYLYSNESSSQIQFVSTAYTLIPLIKDIKIYDTMIRNLMNNSSYKNQYSSEYNALRKRWYETEFNAEEGFFTDRDSGSDSDINYRINYYYDYTLKPAMITQLVSDATFHYTVPYYYNGKLYDRVASRTKLTFNRTY